MQFSKSDGRKHRRHAQNEATQALGSMPKCLRRRQFLPGTNGHYNLLRVTYSKQTTDLHPTRNKWTLCAHTPAVRYTPSTNTISIRNVLRKALIQNLTPDLQAAAACC